MTPRPPPLSPPHETAIRRHTAGTVFLHWAVAICFIVAMATGLALYWRSILGWALPFFGGKEQAVELHLWFGLGLTVFMAVLFLVWSTPARWTPADTHFVRNLRQYAARPDQQPPPETGFFNGGQKLFLWSVVAGLVVLVATGIVWCYRPEVPHAVYAVCRTTHRIVGVILSGALLVHVYKATLGEPGTLRSMITGTVTREWAQTRRPKWYRELGRDD